MQTDVPKDCHPHIAPIRQQAPSHPAKELPPRSAKGMVGPTGTFCPRLALTGFQTPLLLTGSSLRFSWLSPQALQETQSTWYGQAVEL